MFSIFNSLVKQFHGFLSQAVLLNLLREILSKTQNEEPPQVVVYVSNNTSKFINYTRYFLSMGSLKRLFCSNEKGESLIWTNLDIHSLKSLIQTKLFPDLKSQEQKWIGRYAGPKLV